MADQAAADIAIDAAAQAGLLAALRKTKAALDAFRAAAESSGDTPSSDVGCAAVDVPGPGGMTALLVACLQGNAADVEFLLGVGADPTAEGDVWERVQPDLVERKKWKAFPLYLAAREGAGKGHEAVVELLLAHPGVQANQGTTDSGATALYIACEWGSPRVVKMLLACDAIDVNQARTDDGVTPLYIACDKRHPGIIKMLLACDKIDANKARIDDGATSLYAACYEGHTEVIEMLLACDAIDVNQARTDNGAAPLYTACAHGYTGIIRILLADGRADVHTTTTDDSDKLTPLHATAIDGHLVAAQLLVVYGASLTAADIDDETPAQVATAQGHLVLAEWLTAVAGWSPLRVAAGCRLHKDAALLLRQGRADPDNPAATSVQDILQLVATSHAKPAALPWQNAPPICKATIKLVADATRGWHRTTHWLHHEAVRDAVVAVVVVAGRLQAKEALRAGKTPSDALPDADVVAAAAAAAAAACVAEGDPCRGTAPLPLLPIEIWLFAMQFFQRSWWDV